MTKVDEQVEIRLTLQLIKGILKGISNGNGTTILRSFVLPAAGASPVIFTLGLNKTLLPGRSAILLSLFKDGSSLWYFYKLPDDFE